MNMRTINSPSSSETKCMSVICNNFMSNRQFTGVVCGRNNHIRSRRQSEAVADLSQVNKDRRTSNRFISLKIRSVQLSTRISIRLKHVCDRVRLNSNLSWLQLCHLLDRQQNQWLTDLTRRYEADVDFFAVHQ